MLDICIDYSVQVSTLTISADANGAMNSCLTLLVTLFFFQNCGLFASQYLPQQIENDEILTICDHGIFFKTCEFFKISQDFGFV